MDKKISQNIQEFKVGKGLRLLSLPTVGKGFLVIRGSIPVGFLFSKKNRQISEIFAALLTEGAKRKTKEKIREILESRGADIHFSASSHFIEISAECLKEDAKEIIELLFEILREPSFPAASLQSLKTRRVAEESQLKKDTNEMASITLSQSIFAPEHPNYLESHDAVISNIKSVSLSDLNDFHKKVICDAPVTFAVVGDISKKETDILSKNILAMKEREEIIWAVESQKQKFPDKTVERKVEIEDKASTTLLFGQPIKINRFDKDYIPLRVGVGVLGDHGFSARLMSEIRDKHGLTYGISARLNGMNKDTLGCFEVWGTFAPALLKKGQDLTFQEIKKWIERGVTEKELDLRKKNIIGSFKVALGTVHGLAEEIIFEAENGYQKDFIDEYPKIVEKVTLKKVNSVIKRHLSPNKFVIVKAGTLGIKK